LTIGGKILLDVFGEPVHYWATKSGSTAAYGGFRAVNRFII